MPELPEIVNLARQMNQELQSKTISYVEIIHEKCLNTNSAEFNTAVTGKIIGGTRSKGKWIFTNIGEDTTLLLNLGMGGDVLYHKPGEKIPDKYKIKINFTDNSALSINFWWFGYLHTIKNTELKNHIMTSTLGITPIEPDFTLEVFKQLLKGKKTTIKSVILDQKIISGIGNVYAQDILFKAHIHPNRKIRNLTESEIKDLYEAIIENLKNAVNRGGLKFEKDLYGNQGGIENFLVGYKENQPCPVCNTIIIKIKTGSTSSYICPKCQHL